MSDITKYLLVAGVGFEPRCMHKQNYFQLPPAGISPPDYNHFIVRSDIANASEPANDARH